MRIPLTFVLAKLLAAAQKLTTFERPASYEQESVSIFIDKYKPVVKRELEYIQAKDDLVSLRGASEHAKLGALIEKAVNKAKDFLNPDKSHASISNAIASATGVVAGTFGVATGTAGVAVGGATANKGGQKNKPDDDDKKRTWGMQEWLKGNGRAEQTASVLISITMLLLIPILFILPIYALSKVGNNIGKSIGVLLAFALTFTGVLVVATPAKQHEVLGAAAAYVYLQLSLVSVQVLTAAIATWLFWSCSLVVLATMAAVNILAVPAGVQILR